jgi:Glycosyl transferases group 1
MTRPDQVVEKIICPARCHTLDPIGAHPYRHAMRVLIPVCLGITNGSFYQEFVIGVTEALRELGHEPSYFPFDALGTPSRNEIFSLDKQLERSRPDVVLDLACWGFGLSRGLTPTPKGQLPIFDAYGVSYAGILFDQPFNQAINGITASRVYAVYPDLAHPQQVRLVFPGLKLSGEIFAPPAIRAANDRSTGPGSSNRNIEILYVGNLLVTSLTRFWNDRVLPAGFDPEFCDAVVDTVMAEPERSLHLAVESVLSRRPASEGFNFNIHLQCIEEHLRYVFRRDAVLALARAGVRMRVVGKNWDQLALPVNVELQEPTDYEGFFRLAGSARICLDASTYLDGANDRVFAYAVNRAVCFTNASGYLRSAVGEGGGIRFYSLRGLGALVDEVQGWLGRPDALAEMGDRARSTVLGAHTWRHRLTDILAAMMPNPA